MSEHVISGLKTKQWEIRRRISELEGEIKTCRLDLVSISESLRIFGDPEAYVKPEALFGRDDHALRTSPDGLDLQALTGIVARQTASIWETPNLLNWTASVSTVPCIDA